MADSTVPCRNCGQPAGPGFCGACGQSIDDRRSPLLTLVRDAAEDALSLDSRVFRTARALLRPGQLTRLYLDGRRAPFLPPTRLYLLASLILFSSAFALEPPDADAVNFYVGGALLTGAEPVRGRPTVTFMDQNSLMQQWMLSAYAANFARLRAMPPQEALDAVFNGLAGVMPAAMIAFVPVFALALKLLYVRRRVLYVDHVVFAAHFQAALFFAFGIGWLIARLAGFPLVYVMLFEFGVFLLMLTVYLPMALRRVHREPRLATAAKSVLVFMAYLVAMQWVAGPAMLIVISRI